LKTIIAVIVILALLVGGVSGMYLQTSMLYREIDRAFQDLTTKVENENWEAAQKKTGSLKDQWSQAEEFWATFMDHQEIELVDESINKIDSLVQIKEQNDLLVEIHLARSFLYRLKEKESPSIKNIL